MNRLDRKIEECRPTSVDDNETIQPFLLDLELSWHDTSTLMAAGECWS